MEPINRELGGTTVLYNTEKCKKYGIRFTSKTTRFQMDFQVLNARAARFDINSNVHLVYKPKSSCFMRETAVKRISFFNVLCGRSLFSKLFHLQKFYCAVVWSSKQRSKIKNNHSKLSNSQSKRYFYARIPWCCSKKPLSQDRPHHFPTLFFYRKAIFTSIFLDWN